VVFTAKCEGMLIRFMRWLLAIIHTKAEVHTHWGYGKCTRNTAEA